MPLVYDIVASDLFLEDSGDEPQLNAISTDMTGYAFDQCNIYIANDLDSDFTASFSGQPINAWSLGNFQYVINADIDLIPADGQSFTRRYVCRIKYNMKDDKSGVTNPDNWSIEGISGLDEL
ncbi:hypothetical protein [Methylomarinum vadi]|uniref:hypothetical protein n=1 Tax=Methylomarinum vadi TaxID=438855 RepID=UPI001F1E4109|nr:hypothetical protein [Methylomarinum vadi]